MDGINGPRLANFEHRQIAAGDAADRIAGGRTPIRITGAGGKDILRGGGNDEISKSWGVHSVQGGTGFGTLNVGLANTKNPGATLIFDAGAGTIALGVATSGTFGRFEHYQVSGTIHDDTLTLGDAANLGYGAGGANTLTLGGGKDFGDDKTGDDTIHGGAGRDELGNGYAFGGNAREADLL